MRYSPMQTREIQLSLVYDPVPLPRSPSNLEWCRPRGPTPTRPYVCSTAPSDSDTASSYTQGAPAVKTVGVHALLLSTLFRRPPICLVLPGRGDSSPSNRLRSAIGRLATWPSALTLMVRHRRDVSQDTRSDDRRLVLGAWHEWP